MYPPVLALKATYPVNMEIPINGTGGLNNYDLGISTEAVVVFACMSVTLGKNGQGPLNKIIWRDCVETLGVTIAGLSINITMDKAKHELVFSLAAPTKKYPDGFILNVSLVTVLSPTK